MITPSVSPTEKAVLAAILRKPQLWEIAQAAGMDGGCFFSTPYRQIWDAIVQLAAQGKAIEELALMARMPDRAAEIAEIAESIATTANFPQWLGQLKDYKARRVLLKESYAEQEAIGKNTDAKTLLEAHEAAGLAARQILEAGKPDSLQEAAAEALDAIDHPRPSLPIFPSGTEVANAIKFHAGEMIVIAARTGGGKTALAAQMVGELLKGDKVVLYACSESSAAAILLRLAAALTGIPHYKILNGNAAQTEKERFRGAIEHLKDCPRLQIIGSDGNLMTAARICSELKAFRLRQGHVDAVVVDFVQNLAPAPEDARKSRLEQLNNAIQRLHDAFIEERAAGIMLSQFNREALKKETPPDASDLKDTSTLEQLADLVCILYRPDKEALDKTILYTPKHRNIGFAKMCLEWGGAGFISAPEYAADDRAPAVREPAMRGAAKFYGLPCRHTIAGTQSRNFGSK